MKAPGVTQPSNNWNEKRFQLVQNIFDDWRFQGNPTPKEPAADLRAHTAAEQQTDTDKEEERRWKWIREAWPPSQGVLPEDFPLDPARPGLPHPLIT